MATQYMTVEVWVIVTDDEQYVAHEDEAGVVEAFADRIGDMADLGGIRRVKISVKVPVPTVIEVTGEVTSDEETPDLKAV